MYINHYPKSPQVIQKPIQRRPYRGPQIVPIPPHISPPPQVIPIPPHVGPPPRVVPIPPYIEPSYDQFYYYPYNRY